MEFPEIIIMISFSLMSLLGGISIGFTVAQGHLKPIIQTQIEHCQNQCNKFLSDKNEYLACAEECKQVAEDKEN